MVTVILGVLKCFDLFAAVGLLSLREVYPLW